MRLYPTLIILEYVEFLRAITLMRLYPTQIILEYIEFSRANPHEALPDTHNSQVHRISKS